MMTARGSLVVAAATAFWLPPAPAQQYALDVPTEVEAGAEFKVRFSASEAKDEYINYTEPGAELAGAIRQAVDAPFEVLDSNGSVIATGTANGQAVSLPVGNYEVRLRSGKAAGSPVSVRVDAETLVTLD